MTPQEKLKLFWESYKIYCNDPHYILSTTDRLENLLGNKEDLDKICHSLGIQVFSRHITFGKLLTKIGIKI